MTWQILILLHALFSAFYILESRSVARLKQARNGALAVNAMYAVVLYACTLAVMPFIGGSSWQEFMQNWELYAACGVLFNLGMIFTYKALSYLESTDVSVMASSSTVFTIVLAAVFMGERLTASQLIGTAMLLPCILYILLLAKQRQGFRNLIKVQWAKGSEFIFIASLVIALGALAEKQVLERASIGTYAAYGWLLHAVIALVFFGLFGRHARYIFKDREVMKGVALIGVLRTISSLCYVYSLVVSDSLSLITVVSNFRIVVVAVLAGWLLKERKFYFKKLAAAGISVVALSIIFWN